MTELHEVLQELVAHHGIPGAVVGVLDDGRVEAEAAVPVSATASCAAP